MFTTGKIVFVAIFTVVFIAGLVWSYRKDSAVTKVHFTKTYKVLLALILFVILQFIIVKMRTFF